MNDVGCAYHGSTGTGKL